MAKMCSSYVSKEYTSGGLSGCIGVYMACVCSGYVPKDRPRLEAP